VKTIRWSVSAEIVQHYERDAEYIGSFKCDHLGGIEAYCCACKRQWPLTSFPDAEWRSQDHKTAEVPDHPLFIGKPRRKPISDSTRYKVMKRDGFSCSYCTASGVPLHIDHVVPVSRGGTNAIGNLVTACERCNQGKGAS
jgi:5-methylcytosine-specific restriction endonuclease McrA